jgi:hypothetical protein
MGISGCSDADSKLGPIPLKKAANEGPITQNDINAYINILPEIAPVEFTNGKEAAKVYKSFGLSRLRYKYLQAKIVLCAGANAGASFDFSKSPTSLVPNDSELSLVRDNWAAIDAALQVYKQKLIR